MPAAMFTYVEPEWNYMDSLYYCFISLTTIGLGDYIPGDAPDQKYRPLYKLMITGKINVWDCGMNRTRADMYKDRGCDRLIWTDYELNYELRTDSPRYFPLTVSIAFSYYAIELPT